MITIKYFIYLFILFNVINFPTGKFFAMVEVRQPYRCRDFLLMPWYVFYDESSEIPGILRSNAIEWAKKELHPSDMVTLH